MGVLTSLEPVGRKIDVLRVYVTDRLRRSSSRRGEVLALRSAAGPYPPIDPNPMAGSVGRHVVTILPETPLGQAAEMARVSPYLCVPVVSANGTLSGLATEATIARALMGGGDVAGKEELLRSAIAACPLEVPTRFISPMDRASDVAAAMDIAGRDVLPMQAYEGGPFLGLVSRGDLVRELVRPFRPPTIGGMATPHGVYLTTGTASGGVPATALVLMGLITFAAEQLPLVVLGPIGKWAARSVGGGPVALALLQDGVPYIGALAVFLGLIRLTPIAGYHAAEHQVVHAIERSEPLLLENVRAMPRVHPRCGTNLVAGALLFSVVSGVLNPVLARFLPASLASLSYACAGVVALTYWRTVGSFLQDRLTTRPATDAQIASGIRAAREVMERHARIDSAVVLKPHARLWRMGLLQMVIGFAIGYALLGLVELAWPASRSLIGPLLS